LPIDLKSIPADSGNSSKANELGLDTIYTRTDYGKADYGGACPPVGNKAHRYIFTVWALNIDKLPLNADASGAMVGYYLNQHVIKKASMTAYYERKK
jgi:Raf kinase inhibitor-like YbhB/YbcL family protein